MSEYIDSDKKCKGLEEISPYCIFRRILLENSVEKKNYDLAITEWYYRGESYKEKSYCICGHRILENCIIRNIKNKHSLVVGNCCVKKVDVEHRHANQSRINYIELCIEKSKPGWESGFTNDILSKYTHSQAYNYDFRLSPKQVIQLERISGMRYRWIWFKSESHLEKYYELKYGTVDRKLIEKEWKISHESALGFCDKSVFDDLVRNGFTEKEAMSRLKNGLFDF